MGETKPQNVQTAQTPQITKDLEELHPVKSTDYKIHYKRICVNNSINFSIFTFQVIFQQNDTQNSDFFV